MRSEAAAVFLFVVLSNVIANVHALEASWAGFAGPSGRCRAAGRTTALLIVDMQNCFMPYGELPVPGSDAIVPVINSIRESVDFDHVLLTADWHPPGHVSFASAHAHKQPMQVTRPAVNCEHRHERRQC